MQHSQINSNRPDNVSSFFFSLCFQRSLRLPGSHVEKFLHGNNYIFMLTGRSGRRPRPRCYSASVHLCCVCSSWSCPAWSRPEITEWRARPWRCSSTTFCSALSAGWWCRPFTFIVHSSSSSTLAMESLSGYPCCLHKVHTRDVFLNLH